MFVDWDNQVITYTDFTIGRIVLSNEAGANDAHKIILRINTENVNGVVKIFLEFSADGGVSWNQVSSVGSVLESWLSAFVLALGALPNGGVAVPGIIKRDGKLYITFYDSGFDPATTSGLPIVGNVNN